jgi:hypothetical protein
MPEITRCQSPKWLILAVFGHNFHEVRYSHRISLISHSAPRLRVHCPLCHLHPAYHGGTGSPLCSGKRRYPSGQCPEARGRDACHRSQDQQDRHVCKAGVFHTQLGLRLRRRALKYREARLERLRSCLARVGMTGKACGLEWAGDWKTFKEYAHFQYTAGLSLAEIREGKRPATSWPDVSGHKLETSLSNVSGKGLGSSPRLITSCDIRGKVTSEVSERSIVVLTNLRNRLPTGEMISQPFGCEKSFGISILARKAFLPLEADPRHLG